MRAWRRQIATIAWAACLALGSAVALAQAHPTPSDLPATELAKLWIDQAPAVVEARRLLEAASHGAAALRASPHEWTTKVSAQRRRYDSGGTSSEWTAGLERTIRIGGKAELDRQLGDVDLAIGQARVGEARHESARLLAQLWIDALSASRQRELLAEQLGFAQASQRAVQTRRKAGDASTLELSVATADLADVQRQLAAATTAELKAKAKLQATFPGAELPAKTLSEPIALDIGDAAIRERVLAESDSLRMIEGQWKKSELLAARARADRVPDPTVGVYTASEAFRNERVIGLSLSIPLGGNYRSEKMQQALRESDAARARLDQVRREEEIEVAEELAEAKGAMERWRLVSEGLAATRESARLTQRAYSLGEADLQTLLLSRRQSLDASMAAEQARADALRAQHRLLIDAHLIWGLADD